MKNEFRMYLFALAGLLFASCTLAQTTPIKYAGHINAGAPFGENKTNVIIQTIHGVRLNTWFAGIGGGLDAYYQQSLPLFFDVRKNILSKPSTPFVYADAGINLVATTKGHTLSQGFSIKRKPGPYYEIGAGYRVDLTTTAVNFTIGHSFKGYKEEEYGIRYRPNMDPEEDVLLETTSFNLRRISFKIGLEF